MDDFRHKHYAEAALAGDASVKKDIPITFDRGNFEKSLDVMLKGSGIADMDGGLDPRNWFCDEKTVGHHLRPGEDLVTAQKLAGKNLSHGRREIDGILDMGITQDVVKLANSNGGAVNVSTRFTVEFGQLLRSIMPKLPTNYGLKRYFPDQDQYASTVIWDTVDPYGGRTHQYVYGTDPTVVSPPGSSTAKYKPPVYREQMIWNEPDLLFLRELGYARDGLAARGAIQQISVGVEKLMYRMMTRELTSLTTALFDNYFDYKISATGPTNQYFFGIPITNRVTPVYGPWAWRTNVNSPWNFNSSSNGVWDMIQWLNNTKLFFKYRGLIPTIHMNPVTWGALIQNPNVNSWISFAMGNESVLQGEGEKSYANGGFLKTFIPGLERVQIIIEDAAWTPETNIITDADRFYDNSTADFVFPDGMIFFGVDPGPAGGTLGTFQHLISLQNGGIGSPQPGRFIVMDDHLSSGTLGGPAKPYVGLVAGYAGGPAIPRNKDILTANVFVTLS